MKRIVTEVAGRAALLQRDDIDTDALFPARFLRLTQRTGMAAYLFADWHAAGQPEAAFLDAAEPVRILVAPLNFGCGSSREQAVWALADHGVQAIVALSFGDIFRNNCVKNDIVAATLAPHDHAALVQALRTDPGLDLHLDVRARSLQLPGDLDLPLALADGHAEQLLSAEDPIARTLRYRAGILDHEQRVAARQPWLAALD